jgi:hypothetical protein
VVDAVKSLLAVEDREGARTRISSSSLRYRCR